MQARIGDHGAKMDHIHLPNNSISYCLSRLLDVMSKGSIRMQYLLCLLRDIFIHLRWITHHVPDTTPWVVASVLI